jgi:hypothetical protein
LFPPPRYAVYTCDNPICWVILTCVIVGAWMKIRSVAAMCRFAGCNVLEGHCLVDIGKE